MRLEWGLKMSSRFKEYSETKKLNLDLQLIDIIDLEKIINVLPYNELCEPLKKYKGLHKKYASGFSPQKCPIKNLRYQKEPSKQR